MRSSCRALPRSTAPLLFMCHSVMTLCSSTSFGFSGVRGPVTVLKSGVWPAARSDVNV